MGLGSVVWEAPGGRALGGGRAGVWLGDVARCPAWHWPTHSERQQGWRFGGETPEMGTFVSVDGLGATGRVGAATLNPPGSLPGDSCVALCVVALSSGHSTAASVPQFPHPVSPLSLGTAGSWPARGHCGSPGAGTGTCCHPCPCPRRGHGCQQLPPPTPSRWHRSSFPPPFAFFRGFLGFFFLGKAPNQG